MRFAIGAIVLNAAHDSVSGSRRQAVADPVFTDFDRHRDEVLCSGQARCCRRRGHGLNAGAVPFGSKRGAHRDLSALFLSKDAGTSISAPRTGWCFGFMKMATRKRADRYLTTP